MQFQSLLIPLAAAATFAGVYAITPGGKPAVPAPSVSPQPPPAAKVAGKPDNPLAPAHAGLAECSRPDEARKTCRAIATYTPLGGSRYSVTAVMLVSERGPVTLETTSVVAVRSGSVCGRMLRRDLAAGRLRVAGRTIGKADAAPILAAFQRSLTGIMNKEVCSSYLASAEGVTEVSTINGVHLPSLRQPVKWIRLDSGYSIGSESGA